MVHVSVEGTDCRINGRSKLSRMCFSHKFIGPGLRYEIGVSVLTGHIVWVNGPNQCSAYPDRKIFLKDMRGDLLAGEDVVTDKG